MSAPRSTAEQLRSTAFESTYYPDPPKKTKPPPPPPAPTSTAEQLQSSSMSLSKSYVKPPPDAAAGKPSGSSAGIFGDAPPRPPPPPRPPKTAPAPNPSSKAEQNASSVFGTPRHQRPPEPDRASSSGSVFGGGAKTYTRPPEPEKKQIPNATSTAAQNASSVFGTPRYTSPPPQSARKAPPNASGSVAQNASSVFGTPRHQRPSANALLSTSGDGTHGSAKEFAPGEWIMPTPRGAGEGAPNSTSAQQQSASLPGTRFVKPTPQPPPPAKEIARSKNEQQASSVFGTPRFASPPPRAPAGPASVFPNQTKHVAPPKAPKEPPPPIATSKAEQQRSSVFGPSTHVHPPPPTAGSPREATGLRLGPPKSARRQPSPPPPNQNVLTDANGKPRNPETTAEQLMSSVFGGTPTASTLAAQDAMRVRLARSMMKVEFDGFDRSQDSHRLHQVLSALPYDAGVTCTRSKVKVEYGSLDGKATGKGSAHFRNVPDGDKIMDTLAAAQAKGLFGKRASVRIAFDDRKDVNGVLRADTAAGRHRKSTKGKPPDGAVRV